MREAFIKVIGKRGPDSRLRKFMLPVQLYELPPYSLQLRKGNRVWWQLYY